MFTYAYEGEVWIESGGIEDTFFSGVPIFISLIFLVIVTLIVFAIIGSIRSQVETGGLLKDMQQFASQLADYPSDDTANQLGDYLRDVKSFPVARTQMEPFRVALGCYQLIMGSTDVRDETKERVDRQYKRLGILDGEKYADEPAPRTSGSRTHHDHHHNHHNPHM